MQRAGEFAVNPGWRIWLIDLGIRPDAVLRRAGLPRDLFARDRASLSSSSYYRFWEALEAEAEDPALPIRIGSSIPVEAFDPPIFAALCSPDLNTAARRISLFKRLIGPMALHVDERRDATELEIEWLDKTLEPPAVLVAAELAFWAGLVRLATRADIHALRVTTPDPPSPPGTYEEYFGVAVRRNKKHAVTFTAEDARRPFLTANEQMWQFFEPELRRRLSELDETATMSDRVRAALFELLPSGRTSIEAISETLGVSVRTLQRRLREEGSSFQHVLDATRGDLARHYLRSSVLSGAEISLLLGFDDPNFFSRAFRAWTGKTPESVRNALRTT